MIKDKIKIFFILLILIVFYTKNVFASDLLDISNLSGFSFQEGKEDEDGNGDMKFHVTPPSENAEKDFWTVIYTEYKGVIMGVSAIITMTFVVFFVRNIIGFSINADNPNERKKSVTGLLWTGIGLALTSSLTIYLGVIFRALK